MTVPILYDDDVRRLVSMREAVSAIEEALAQKARGEFLTPPRHYLANKNGALAFTSGGHNDGGVIGFRVYDTFPGNAQHEQFVAVFDSKTGELKGLVFGSLLGALRTGAIGGVAAKYGAREDARSVGVVGSGQQARPQLEAVAAVRELRDVRVYSRSRERREAFAAEMSERIGVDVTPVASVEDVLLGADIVIEATDSETPVFTAALVEPGCHVTTVGPKYVGRHALDPAVAERAASIFTDSIDQMRGYPVLFFLAETEHMERVSDLAEHVAGGKPVRRSNEEITLFCSVGVSGTEVVVADIALSKRGAGVA